MQDILNQLLNALQQNEAAQIYSLDTQRENSFAGINNNNNARGTLFSSAPAIQQTQYDASTYLPQYSDIRQNTQDQTLNTTNSFQQAVDQIKEYEEATALLNAS